MEKEKVLKALNNLLKEYKHFWWERKSNEFEENYLEILNQDEDNEYYDDPFANPEYDREIQEILKKSDALTIQDLPKIECYYSMYLDKNNDLKVLLNYHLLDGYLSGHSCDYHKIEFEEEHEISEDYTNISSEFKNIRFKDYYVILLENNEQPDQTLEKIISELNNFNLPQEVHIQFMQLSESGVYKTVRKGISKKWLDQIILRLKLKNF